MTWRIGSDQALQMFLIATIILTTVLSAIVAGPLVETRFWPVLDVSITTLDDGSRLEFTVDGTKDRDCALLTTSYAWRIAGVLMPTGVADAKGAPLSPNLLAPGVVHATPRFALVPAAARLTPGVQFVMTFYYRCTPLWVTVQEVDASVLLAPPPPVVSPPA